LRRAFELVRTFRVVIAGSFALLPLSFTTGCTLFMGSDRSTAPAVTLAANPTEISPGATSTLSAVAANVTTLVITGSDGSNYNINPTGGTQTVKPSKTTTYTATATGSKGQATATATVTVTSHANLQSEPHVR